MEDNKSTAESIKVLVDAVKDLEKSPAPAMVARLARSIKVINPPVPRYFENAKQISSYAEPEFDISATFKLLKYEPYFLKSVQKKQSLLVKSGLSIQSDSDTIKRYIDARFNLMFLQTAKSLRDIVTQLAYYLIVCSNAFLIKVRDKDFEHAQSFTKDNKEMYPVVGLFPVHPTSMKPKFKSIKLKKGLYQLAIDKWIHFNARGMTVEFDPDDVVHFTTLKEDGMIFGMPEVIPVIDDIRTLRKIEEDVQLLIYRDLFPILHYTIENPSIIDPRSGETELDRARSDLERLIQDGGIATPESHKIQLIGSEGKYLDVKPYLEYFQQRVFTGLGVSPTDMGIGKDISGNTATSMSKQLTDAVRFIQKELASQFNELVLTELILQSEFGLEAFRDGTMPTLEFFETDIEWKIRQENHEADLFQKGVKDIDEVRNKLGLGEMKDISRTQIGLYGQAQVDQNTEASEHLAKVQASVTPKTVKSATGGTKQVGGLKKDPGTWNNPTSTGTSKTGKSAAEKDPVKSAKSNSNIVKSARDAVDSISISDEFKSLMEPINNIADKAKRRLSIVVALKCTYEGIKENMIDSYLDGVSAANIDLGIVTDSDNFSIDFNIFETLDRIRDNMVDKLDGDPSYINKAAARIAMANRTERTRAYNFGYAITCVNNNRNHFVIYSNSDEVSSDSAELIGKELELNEKNIANKVPPFRPNSRLKIKIKEKSND